GERRDHPGGLELPRLRAAALDRLRPRLAPQLPFRRGSGPEPLLALRTGAPALQRRFGWADGGPRDRPPLLLDVDPVGGTGGVPERPTRGGAVCARRLDLLLLPLGPAPGPDR